MANGERIGQKENRKRKKERREKENKGEKINGQKRRKTKELN